MDHCRPQASAWPTASQCGQGVIFVSEPGGVGVGDVWWQRAGSYYPHLGGGVVNMAREFHFFHHFRAVLVGAVISVAVAVASTVMFHVPSGSVTRAVMGRPRCCAQVASNSRVLVRPSSMLVAQSVRVIPATVTVVAASVLICARADGQVCTSSSPFWSFWCGCASNDAQSQ